MIRSGQCFLILILLFSLNSDVSSQIQPDVAEMRDHFKLTWNDEFEGDQLDKAKWFYRTDNKHRSIQRRENVVIKNGHLNLNLLPLEKPVQGKSLSGAGIVSQKRFRYGYYEVRAKLGDNRDDDNDGDVDEGWHHAFWAMAAEGNEAGEVKTTYPGIRRTEIDCYEYASDRNFFTQHVIIWKPDGKEFGRRPIPPTDKVPTSDVKLHEWNTYGFEWNEKSCRFYINGKLNRVGKYPVKNFEHDELNIWLTAISANWNKAGGEKSEAVYDYVRFFELKSDNYKAQEKKPPAVIESKDDERNLARNAKITVSSTHNDYGAENLNDGIVSDESRWLNSPDDKTPTAEFEFEKPLRLGGLHVFSGYQGGSAVTNIEVMFEKDGNWIDIPSANIRDNDGKRTALRIPFDENVNVTTKKLRFAFPPPQHKNFARIREIKVWPYEAKGIPQIALRIANPFAEEDARIPKIYLNQSGFNAGKPKRFTTPLMKSGSFEVRLASEKKPYESDPLFQGTIENHIGDFSSFEPDSNEEFVVVTKDQTSVPFRIGKFWLERVSYQNAVDFMIDSRHYVGNYQKKCRGSYAWRDDHHFAFTLNTLVPQYLSNPSAYDRMPKRIQYENVGNGRMGVLEPYSKDAPDIVKMIHFNADVIVTQKPEHMLMKEQLAYFLYVWPWIKQWCPQQNFDAVHKYATDVWTKPEHDNKFPFDTTKENHNLLEVKKEIGTTKGESPPGHAILPNLLMYEVAKRQGDEDAEKYFDAAYKQTEWLVANLDWNDPLTTKGQRMSEHVTMTGLGVMAMRYGPQAPAGLKEKLKTWSKIAIGRSSNLWDFRKLADDQWTPTGSAPTHWNEPGNLMGFPACALAVMEGVPDLQDKDRMTQLIWSQLDNLFGRNPCGRHASYDAPKEIEGVEFGWYSFYVGGVGQLEDVRFVFDGTCKNEHYPYHPELANVGWTEGWVNFNTAYNHSIAWLAFSETQIEGTWENGKLSVRLRAPINFDYSKQESATVFVTLNDGNLKRLTVNESEMSSEWLEGELALGQKPKSVSYGFGYFENSLTF